jgi:hypothetical protein
MRDERKRHWSWIVTIPIDLLLLYVALFGPACWLWGHGWISNELMWVVARPAAFSIQHLPRELVEAFRWWATLGGIGCSDIALYFIMH